MKLKVEHHHLKKYLSSIKLREILFNEMEKASILAFLR